MHTCERKRYVKTCSRSLVEIAKEMIYMERLRIYKEFESNARSRRNVTNCALCFNHKAIMLYAYIIIISVQFTFKIHF